jgi:hypothetical protein
MRFASAMHRADASCCASGRVVRAALAAALWADGSRAAAETEWDRVDDPRCVHSLFVAWLLPLSLAFLRMHLTPDGYPAPPAARSYKDRNWLRRDRRWPPELAGAMRVRAMLRCAHDAALACSRC